MRLHAMVVTSGFTLAAWVCLVRSIDITPTLMSAGYVARVVCRTFQLHYSSRLLPKHPIFMIV